MFAVSATSIDPEDPLSGLTLGDVPDPEVPEGWVRVAVRAASLNHHDLWTLRGVGITPDRLPMILGCDAAGVLPDGTEVVVHAVVGDPRAGRGDETLDPRRSLLSELHQGTLAEYVVVPERNALPKPPELSFEDAACLPTAWLTAYRMLTTKAGLRMGDTVLVQGAGRTDAGVHARGQVAHVDLTREWRTDTVRDALNAHLRPHPVAVLSAEQVGDDFNARMSAIKRHYFYRIINRRPDLTFDRNYAWRVARPLDADAMHTAAQRLVGKRDFTTFRSTECQAKSPDKTLDRLDVSRIGDEVHVFASARSFLHNQVRSMVGTLMSTGLTGAGAWTADDLSAALEARNRTACGQVAPPDGLYLMKVDY